MSQSVLNDRRAIAKRLFDARSARNSRKSASRWSYRTMPVSRLSRIANRMSVAPKVLKPRRSRRFLPARAFSTGTFCAGTDFFCSMPRHGLVVAAGASIDQSREIIEIATP
jgi:hypothetical protein